MAEHAASKPTGRRGLIAVDLFCGAGGFSLAALKSGMSVVAALELSPHACATYLANFSSVEPSPPILFPKDITEFPPSTFMERTGLQSGQVDILMGGPPCQGFSTHRIKGSGIDDPRNKLILHYFEYLFALRPKAFVVENVPGMLWPRHAEYVEAFYLLSKQAGYTVLPPKLINARDHGVPQNRKRAFILGFRGEVPAGLTWPPTPTAFAPTSREVLEHGLPAWRTAQSVFDRPIAETDPNAIHMHHTPRIVEVFKSTPSNGGSRHQSCRVLPCHQTHNGHKDVYGRIDPHHPGPTMTTACINPSKGRFLHPTEHHGISVRHAARFQTFPDDFVFTGGIIAAGVQVGNAVPVLLGQAVLNTIAAALRHPEDE